MRCNYISYILLSTTDSMQENCENIWHSLNCFLKLLLPSSFTLITTGCIETYQIATYSIRTLLKMDYWSPKHVELLNVMNKINHQILCILLDYRLKTDFTTAQYPYVHILFIYFYYYFNVCLRVFTIVLLKQTTFLWYIMLQRFNGYNTMHGIFNISLDKRFIPLL